MDTFDRNGKVAVGDNVPSFTALDENGDTFTSEMLKGKKHILFFYPKDDTPTCTKESCNLRDNYDYLKSQGYEVIGISKDSEKRHQKFIEKYNLPFKLLSDTDLNVLNAFGYHGPKKFMGRIYDGTYRTTVITDENAVITHIIYDVKSANHTEQIAKLLGLEY